MSKLQKDLMLVKNEFVDRVQIAQPDPETIKVSIPGQTFTIMVIEYPAIMVILSEGQEPVTTSGRLPELISDLLKNPSDTLSESTSEVFDDAEFYDSEHHEFDYHEDSLSTAWVKELDEDLARYQDQYSHFGVDIATRRFLGFNSHEAVLVFEPTSLVKPVTLDAWGADSKLPFKIVFHFDGSYLGPNPPKIEIFQEDRRAQFGLKYQLESISSSWLSENWPQIVTKMNSGSNTSEPVTVPVANDEEVSQIVEMGFSINLAKYALSLGKGVMQAMEMIVSGTITEEHVKPVPPVLNLKRRAVIDDQTFIPKEEIILDWTSGFFNLFMDYFQQRLKTLPNYCVICDQPHRFSNLLKPTVCVRPLCSFSFQQLGVAGDAVNQLTATPEVIDLLILLLKIAARSTRRDTVVNPFPLVVNPIRSTDLIFNPDSPDFKKLESQMEKFPSMRELTRKKDFNGVREALDIKSPHSYLLLQWVITSNRSHLVKLNPEALIKSLKTTHQFLMLSQNPEREAKFLKHKEKFGSFFAFHGSSIDNWHSILRRGLINCSGTKMQLHGAAHGNGIYLALDSATSANYSGYYYGGNTSSGQKDVKEKDGDGKAGFIPSERVSCLAVCEVIKDEKGIRSNGNIRVVPKEEYVCTRFLLVYPPETHIPNVNTTQITMEIQKTLSLYQY